MRNGMSSPLTRAEKLGKWYQSIKFFFGDSGVGENFGEGVDCLELCADVVDDAAWLLSIFKDHMSSGVANLLKSLKSQAKLDLDSSYDPRKRARALYFVARSGGLGAYFVDPDGRKMILQSAEMGYVLAQFFMAECCKACEECFHWAEKAAAQGHPDAMYMLAYYSLEDTPLKDVLTLPTALSWMRRAAELEQPFALREYAIRTFSCDDPQRYRWLGRALRAGSYAAESDLVKAVLAKNNVFDRIVCEIGQIFQDRFPCHVGFAINHASKCYRTVVVHARMAIDCWTFVAKRLGLIKDLRVYVAKMLWEERTFWADMVANLQGQVQDAPQDE